VRALDLNILQLFVFDLKVLPLADLGATANVFAINSRGSRQRVKIET
jgi:hypothetical protein